MKLYLRQSQIKIDHMSVTSFLCLMKKVLEVPSSPLFLYIRREFTVTIVTDVETEFITPRCGLANTDSERINFFLLIFSQP